MAKNDSPINNLYNNGLIDKTDRDRHLRDIEDNIDALRDHLKKQKLQSSKMIEELKSSPEKKKLFFKLYPQYRVVLS